MSDIPPPRKTPVFRRSRVMPFLSVLWVALAAILLFVLVWAQPRYHLPTDVVTVLKALIVVIVGLRVIRNIEGALAGHRLRNLERINYHQGQVLTHLAWQDTVTGIYLTRLLLYAALVLVAIFVVGGTFSGLLVGGTLISVMLGVAGQSFFANFFGGLAIALFKPFELGDHVQIIAWQFPMMAATYPHPMGAQGYRGVIRDINLFYSELRLDDGQLFRIPNGVVITAGLIRSLPHEWARIAFRFDMATSPDISDLLARIEVAAGYHFRPRPEEPVADPQRTQRDGGTSDVPAAAPFGWESPRVLIADMSPTVVSVEVRASVPQKLRDTAKGQFFAALLAFIHPPLKDAPPPKDASPFRDVSPLKDVP
ncbi:MAG: mechanosensitive ion channel domain-containing protein [Acidiferrobacter sp.]